MSALLCTIDVQQVERMSVGCAVGEGAQPVLSTDAFEGPTISEQHCRCIAVCCEALQRGREHKHVPPDHVAVVGEHECGESRDTFQDSHVSHECHHA